MLDILTDPLAKGVEDDLPDDKEEDSEQDIAQGPAILQRVHHENDLHKHVDEQLDPIDEVQDDKQAGRVHGPQSRPSLEGEQTDGEGNDKHAQRRQAQQPHRQRGAVLVELKAHEPVDEQTRTQRARQAVLDRGKVGEDARRAGGDDASVQHQAHDRQQHVEVEEGGDLLAADGGELGAHVQDHDDGHGQREDVHGVGGALEDDGVGQLDGARIAGGHDAHGGGGGGGELERARADERAERDGGLRAYSGEVAERHGGRWGGLK